MAVSLASQALAQTDQQIEWCAGKENPTPDLQIASCTASIQSRRLSGKDLSITYSQRGNAYYTKGQYDRAIQDYERAIRLNPKDFLTFANRGMAYFIIGQYDRAIQDCDQAIQLDP